MANSDFEKLNMGAPKLNDEALIRDEIERDFPHLSPEEKNAMIQSRLKILSNPRRPALIKVDLGEDASRKIKEDIFE